jgi:hypothetical protein
MIIRVCNRLKKVQKRNFCNELKPDGKTLFALVGEAISLGFSEGFSVAGRGQ